MFRDRKEELERLENELLTEDQKEPDMDFSDKLDAQDIQTGEEPLIYQNFSNEYGKEMEAGEDIHREKPAALWVVLGLLVLIGAVSCYVLWVYLSLGGLL